VPPGAEGPGTDLRAYLFALAPLAVAFAITPALAVLPAPLELRLGPFRSGGVALAAAGLGLVGWTLQAFAAAGEPPSPADSPDRLVTRGPLAYSRNPLYLGTVLAAAGVAVALESVVALSYAGVLWLVYHAVVVVHEEPQLREQFGDRYDRYRERVPRWLRPFELW